MDEPWTIGRLLDWTTLFLQGKGVESARLEAQLLLAHALSCSRVSLYTRYAEEPAETDRTKFRELVQERVKGRPVAHLLGVKEFFSLEFEVGPAVLIPRPETEWVVTECLTLAKPMEAPSVLDVGTGSGCIAVGVAHRHKGAKVTAIDVSGEALEVARRNVERHKVGDRVIVLEGDLFAPLGAGARFDFILSNPPYIPRGEIATLDALVRDHEPRLALDGGVSGFDVFDRLLAQAPAHLSDGGWLIVEIGGKQETEARRRIEQRSGFELQKTVHDHNGVPRVLKARWRG